jgi:hypothetical protein
MIPHPRRRAGVVVLYVLRRNLLVLGIHQAAAVALPVLLCAAALETYVTPALVTAAGEMASTSRGHMIGA